MYIRSFACRDRLRNLLKQHFSTILLQRNLSQMFVLVMEPYVKGFHDTKGAISQSY